MRIRKRPSATPRIGPVKHGNGNHGKRRLVAAVMNRGFSQRIAAKAVNAVIERWKRAILAKDQHIEMPMGHLKVKKTPSRLYKKRYTTRMLFGKKLPYLKSWTIYNDPYRIIWRMPDKQWEELNSAVNSPNDSALSEQALVARTAASMDAEIRSLFDAVYCQPHDREMHALLEATGGKEQLLQVLQSIKRRGRRFVPGYPTGFLAEVVYRKRMLRERERRDGK